MKCDDCLNLLEEYIDGEAAERDAEQVNAHLITCASCSTQLEALTGEQEVYARYDRDLEISPSMWNAIAARTVAENGTLDSRERFSFGEWFAGLFGAPRYGFAGAVAVVILAIVIGVMYLRTRTIKQPAKQLDIAKTAQPSTVNIVNESDTAIKVSPKVSPDEGSRDLVKYQNGPEHNVTKTPTPLVAKQPRSSNQPDVLYTDVAYTDIEDKDTASHLDQAQNLLLSFRTIKYSDDDEQVDVSYERAESRRLLNENIVLRRDAEMAGKFPAKSVLGSLEPFLIDIANLPEKASPNDVRQIKDRMQKTEIVAELRSY
jgi:hypothetical protein